MSVSKHTGTRAGRGKTGRSMVSTRGQSTAETQLQSTHKDTTTKMFEKSGKYYADWRDKRGKRLRKSFTSKRAALLFEAEQKEQAHPKKTARGRLLLRFSAPDTSRSETAAMPTKLQKASSRPQGHSHPTNSQPATSPKSKKASANVVTLSAHRHADSLRSGQSSAICGPTMGRRNSTAKSQKCKA
jgi:hypothetical protein